MPDLPPSKHFPPAEFADEDGFLGVGGELSPEWLLDAYSHGIFPWPWDGRPAAPIPWFSPDPRAVLPLDDRFHVPRRLQRTCRSGRFRVTFNQSMSDVIRCCAAQPDRVGETWIFPRMIGAYTELHQLGAVGSVEVWSDDRLVGGLYGVTIGGLFSAESMFHAERDASKVALVALVERLRERNIKLLDIQQMTSHLEQFGAIEIAREDYLAQLAIALQCGAKSFVEMKKDK